MFFLAWIDIWKVIKIDGLSFLGKKIFYTNFDDL